MMRRSFDSAPDGAAAGETQIDNSECGNPLHAGCAGYRYGFAGLNLGIGVMAETGMQRACSGVIFPNLDPTEQLRDKLLRRALTGGGVGRMDGIVAAPLSALARAAGLTTT
jgi:hypothetical protein